MPQFADRVKVTTASGTAFGTGAVTLVSTAATGYQAFPSSLDGETVGYVIESGSAWEIGTGTYTHSSLNLTRSLRSSSTGSLLSLAAGTHTVFLTPAFQDIQIVEAFSSTSDLPAASDNHGRVYHVHGEGALYFAHSGSWVKLANYSDITTYTHPNHSGEVTSTGDGATVIADDVVDEANLKVSNTPTDGYVLTARSGNTGGMTWEAVSGGGGSSTSALTETTFSATANQTAFPVSGGITNASNVSVFQNGVKLEEGASKDYTASASTNTVTLNSGAAAGDVVEVLEYGQPNSITDLSDTPSSLGTAGQTLVVNSGGTALEFGAASGGSMTVYNDVNGTDGTPSGYTYLTNASSPSNGDLAFVTANNTVYVRAASGWRKIATVQEAPSTVTGHASSYPEIGQNATTDITLSTTDPEGFDVTWSYVVGGNGTLSGSNINNSNGDTLASIAVQTANANSGGTNTITFRITRQTTTIAGNFTITFTATDSQSTGTSDTGAISFTLQFIIDDSHYTTLLMVTDGSAGDNNNDISDAMGNHTSNITVSDSPSAGTFSPYRHGGYSNYFDGSGDFLAMADDASFGWGTGSWTFEVWLYITKTGGFNAIFDTRVGTGSETGSFGLGVHTTGKVQMYASPAAFYYPQGSGDVLSFNTWQHLAIVKNASTNVTTMYFNGTAASGTYSDTRNYGASQPVQIGKDDTTSNYFGGYMRDMRVVKGTAVYTGNFTPPTGPLTTTGGEYSSTTNVNTSITASHTSLLTCHLPYFSDGSSNDHSITVNGDPETKPFGPYDHEQYSESTNGGSIEFDGSNDGLTITDSADFDLSTGNWTIEFWWNPKSVNTNEGPMSVGYASGNTPAGLKFAWESNRLYLFAGLGNGSVLTSLYLDATAASLVNRWNHIAAVYDGTNTDLFLNGTSSGRAQNSNYGAYDGSADLRVGSVNRISAIHYSECSITDVRIVKGTAVYSGAFTPPTGPLTATGGTYPSTTNVNTSITSGHTKLLISGTDAHVLDKSQGSNLKLFGNAAAVTNATNNSNISSTNALSLDGTGDYATAIITPINGVDFTVEAWVRKSAQGSTQVICGTRTTSSDTTGFSLVVNSANELAFYTNAYNAQSSSLNFPANTWVHVAAVRSGNSLTLYKDGSSVATGTSSHTFSKDVMYIGQNVSTQYWNGYIQDLRVSVGKARTISVPSSPLKG